MFPLPAVRFSSKVIVGLVVIDTAVAAADGVNDERTGAVVSMVMESVLDAADVLDAASTCVAVMLQVPSARVGSVQVPPEVLPVMVQVTLLEPDFVAVTVTVPPASAAVTEMSGVLSFVMLSVEDEPVSEPATRSGVPGVFGAVTSDVVVKESAESPPDNDIAATKFPATSVNVLLACVMQYLVLAAKLFVGSIVAVVPAIETWALFPAMVAKVPVHVAPE